MSSSTEIQNWKNQTLTQCTWTFTNNNAVTDERQWYKMVGKVTVTDSPVVIPPHTNGTYTFSIILKDLDAGKYEIRLQYRDVTADIHSDWKSFRLS